MSLAIVYSRALTGIDAPQVIVEVHLSNGLPSLSIVGLPEAAVKESRDRVRGALLNTNFEFPARRIIVNLAPADLPKEGGRFDLPIAIGILAASGQIQNDKLHQYEFVGELALSGEIRPVKGALPVAIKCRQRKRSLFLPEQNADEAVMAESVEAFAASHLLQVCSHLNQIDKIPVHVSSRHTRIDDHSALLDISDVKGQHHAKRALEVAAAGGHSLLMIGPPGTGKTMLASRLPGIMPAMSEQEALESATISSISDQGLDVSRWGQRSFRSPHHTASGVALVGGGSNPRPGEISLAHNGILFLDELPEFDRKVLEVLREPLESGHITISRAARQAEFPARFQLVAAMNPCPCGYHGHENGRCNCTSEQIKRYRNRISGPLLDRIDMHIEVPHVPRQQLQQQSERTPINSKQLRERVEFAREQQLRRSNKCNAQLTNRELEQVCRLSENDEALLDQAIDRFGFSSRAYHRILKVARTLADLELCENVQTQHITEAINYRKLDRQQATVRLY
ncbi:YifB family Mg chelatase-like AAA ATPase [Kaarinaea lacus]